MALNSAPVHHSSTPRAAMTRLRPILTTLALGASASGFAATPLVGQAGGALTPDSATLAGLRWRSVGPVNTAGRITDVEAHPASPNMQVPGFPRGFDPRPAERVMADSTGSPTYQARQLAQPAAGGRGQGGGEFGGGFGGGRALSPVETGDYRVVLHIGTTAAAQPLRVVRVAPEERAVLIPTKR